MTPLDPAAAIESWHTHVYFDALRRDAAWALREVIATALAGLVLRDRERRAKRDLKCRVPGAKERLAAHSAKRAEYRTANP
jgi:hypothetical protein